MGKNRISSKKYAKNAPSKYFANTMQLKCGLLQRQRQQQAVFLTKQFQQLINNS